MTGPLGWWFRTPLFLRITLGLALGVIAGLILGPHWQGDDSSRWMLAITRVFSEVSRLTLRILGAIAPVLILFAVMKSLISTHIQGRVAARLIYLLLLNTTVAICIGLLVANALKPGADSRLGGGHLTPTHTDPLTEFLNSVPSSLLGPLVEGNSIGVIILALSFGLAGRKLPDDKKAAMLKGITVGFDLIVLVLYWALELVPLAVMCKVAFITTTSGFSPFKSLGRFVLAVLVALLLQSCYYMVRLRWLSWVRPLQLVSGIRDALVMAFSTDSSAATMPLTYECMINRVGIRQESASLGVLVGGNFNHDGTALYQAMSTLFIAQLEGFHLSLVQQFMVVVTGVVASVGMAGIPEAGLVTMALIFNAVGLPVADIALLLPIDWFLDRCRTTINVLGDTSVACLLEGKHKGELPAQNESPALVQSIAAEPAAALFTLDRIINREGARKK
jgi:DAACS family dicarboxylate/amino acid:cation (Na+ or H+) symporter